MSIIRHISLYVLAVLRDGCVTLYLEQSGLQDFGEETEGKIILGSLAVEGKHFKLMFWGYDGEA